MDIFEYAMQMENDGENYYRELADKTANQGLKTILTMLADDEAKHFAAVKKAQTAETEVAETAVLSDSMNIFLQMRQAGEVIDPAIDQVALYEKARDIERKSEDFYREKAQEVENEHHKGLFLMLAEEEKKHYFLLDNIVEFVSRPQTWLENAEFSRLEDY